MDNLGDLSALLTPLLNDPQAMDNLRAAAEQMGLGDLLTGGAPAEHKPDDPGQPKNTSAPEMARSAPEMPGAELLSAVTKLAPLLSAPQEDDTTRLLAALRPFLSRHRLQKLDKAERLLSMTRLLSILKESKLM